MVLARGSFPPLPFRSLSCKSQQPAIAEIAARLGGNLTTHVGHVVGGDDVAGTPNPAPVNPSGDRGHDHSGGDYGRPLFRSVATLDFNGGAFDLAGWHPAPRAHQKDHPATAGGTTTRETHTGFFALWVPPCDPQPDVGAYAWLGVGCGITLTATALGAGDTASVLVRNVTRGAPATEVGVSIGGALTSSPAELWAWSDADAERLPVTPGRMNLLQVSTSVVRAAGGSARGCTLRLDSLELGVYSS